MSSRLLGLVVCMGASLAWAAPASGLPLDSSFGEGGVIRLSSEPAPQVVDYAKSFAVSRDGSIYLLQERYPCINRGRTCDRSISLVRLGPDGEPDPTFAGDGRLDLSFGGVAEEIVVDSSGRVLVGFGYEYGPHRSVTRVDSSGAIDRSFGVNGVATISCECDSGSLRLLPLRAGRLLVAVLWRDKEPGARRYFGGIEVHRLGPSGEVERTYGDNGLATAKVANAARPREVIALARGGLAFAGEGTERMAGPWVARIGPGGGFDRSFLRRARVAVGTRVYREEQESQIGALVSRPGGRLDLFGGRGSRGFVLRLRPGGKAEGRFGSRGLKLLPRPITAAVGTPAGRSFVISPRLEREGWHSEYGLFSALLGRDGSPLGKFSRGRGALRWASAFGALSLQGGRRALLFDPGDAFEGCRSYCPPLPGLYGFQVR